MQDRKSELSASLQELMSAVAIETSPRLANTNQQRVQAVERRVAAGMHAIGWFGEFDADSAPLPARQAVGVSRQVLQCLKLQSLASCGWKPS